MPVSDFPHLIWMDLEMSGLDPESDLILEIASIITNSQLDLIEVGPNIVIHQQASLFDKMDAWNQKQHTKSGLWKKVLDSKVGLTEAEEITLAFISKHTNPQKSPLCGNTIYQDKRFLRKYMPKIDNHLHYRVIDVSSIKELGHRWYTNVPVKSKSNTHRALDDIHESIEELKHYRQQIFVKEIPSPNTPEGGE